MPAVFLALIEQLNSSVFVLVAILVVMFWLVYKSGGWVQAYKDFQDKNGKTETKIDSMKENIALIKATADLLYQAHLSTIKANSPISLTERGKQIGDAIKAEMKVASHWSDIKAMVQSKNPTNPYDIQTIALEIARNCFDKIFTPQEQDEVKTHAYNIGLNMLEIYPVIGVIIRDKFFQEEGIATEDVDRHDPTKR